jgi:hypothetical protein
MFLTKTQNVEAGCFQEHFFGLQMFLVSDERLQLYALPVQVLLLSIALAVVIWLFFTSFYEEFHKIVFTDEPRVPSDYAGFLLCCANIIVIIATAYRLLKRVAKLLNKYIG